MTRRIIGGSRANGDVGLFISPPGVDAFTAADAALILNVTSKVSQLLLLGRASSSQTCRIICAAAAQTEQHLFGLLRSPRRAPPTAPIAEAVRPIARVWCVGLIGRETERDRSAPDLVGSNAHTCRSSGQTGAQEHPRCSRDEDCHPTYSILHQRRSEPERRFIGSRSLAGLNALPPGERNKIRHGMAECTRHTRR